VQTSLHLTRMATGPTPRHELSFRRGTTSYHMKEGLVPLHDKAYGKEWPTEKPKTPITNDHFSTKRMQLYRERDELLCRERAGTPIGGCQQEPKKTSEARGIELGDEKRQTI